MYPTIVGATPVYVARASDRGRVLAAVGLTTTLFSVVLTVFASPFIPLTMFPAIPGLVLSIIGWQQSRRMGSSNPLAAAGIIFGIVVLAIAGYFLAMIYHLAIG